MQASKCVWALGAASARQTEELGLLPMRVLYSDGASTLCGEAQTRAWPLRRNEAVGTFAAQLLMRPAWLRRVS